MPGNTAYCLSKGGMRMLTRTAGVELAPHDILVVGRRPRAPSTRPSTRPPWPTRRPGHPRRRHPHRPAGPARGDRQRRGLPGRRRRQLRHRHHHLRRRRDHAVQPGSLRRTAGPLDGDAAPPSDHPGPARAVFTSCRPRPPHRRRLGLRHVRHPGPVLASTFESCTGDRLERTGHRVRGRRSLAGYTADPLGRSRAAGLAIPSTRVRDGDLGPLELARLRPASDRCPAGRIRARGREVDPGPGAGKLQTTRPRGQVHAPGRPWPTPPVGRSGRAARLPAPLGGRASRHARRGQLGPGRAHRPPGRRHHHPADRGRRGHAPEPLRRWSSPSSSPPWRPSTRADRPRSRAGPRHRPGHGPGPPAHRPTSAPTPSPRTWSS